jgi:pyruvate/2-oxoglutarate dehydrogenase complex dihydrolipoamide dehydrogenase (E3) component
VPESLVIVGGGVVALEMATAFVDFGTEVTIVSRGALLANLEPFAGELVAASLRERGATVLEHTGTASVHRDGDGVVLETSDGRSIRASEVLVATGRTPRTRDLGLDTVQGAELVEGASLEVDDTMRVQGIDWLYAAGDVNGRALLTHQGKYQARAAGDVIVARAKGEPVDDADWGRHVATADRRAVPQVTFTDPEVASVGLTAAQAKDAGFDTAVVDYELGSIAGASVREDDYTGKARFVINRARDVILGATFVGPDVSDLLQAATIAVAAEVPVSRLWHAVPAYPTVSEIWLRLLETYGRDSA